MISKMVFMWMTMMIAMMLPVVAPWILSLSKIINKDTPGQSSLVSAGLFLLGYLTVWTSFSFIATSFQWVLQYNTLLSSDQKIVNTIANGIVLLLAGIYQFTPYKKACLYHCRTPISFFLTSWKEGKLGVYQMGLQHGLFCLGCCWALMLLSFVFGLMNMIWMAIITFQLIAEKILPFGEYTGKAAGVVYISLGISLFF